MKLHSLPVLCWLFALSLAGAGLRLAAQQSARKIQPNDLLRIQVLGEDMSKEAKVTADGKINYFFVNEVSVAGKTLSEAQEQIQQLLKTWFVNPQVSIEMKEYAQEVVTVRGKSAVRNAAAAQRPAGGCDQASGWPGILRVWPKDENRAAAEGEAYSALL
ncbi:MAG: polysaccharide biosynthesis/export family protein [Verrucomicrobiae bacterium]|nr:polysaccharide biosynthesis/export family protein [Verrucomicrobiae bacterium]